jgi:hypothetical protein
MRFMVSLAYDEPRPNSSLFPQLLSGPLSDKLSDMKTFTVRDLDRQPGVVLDACDQEGAVHIRRRDGRTYTMRRDDVPEQSVPWRKLMAAHRARIAEIFPEPISAEQGRSVDRLIAGE